MRVLLSSLMLVGLSAAAAAWAATSLDAATQKQLAKVERKYFGHSFDSDADESRASRLEQLIFGEDGSGNGSAKERIEKIIAVSPVQEEVPAESAPTVKTSRKNNRVVQAPFSSEAVPLPPEYRPKDKARPLAAEDAMELRDYPHITALEQSIIGETYASDPLSARLARLETKAFGTPSMLPDLSARTDALEEYAEKKLHKQSFAQKQQEQADASDARVNHPSPPQQAAAPRAAKLAMVANTLLGAAGMGLPMGMMGGPGVPMGRGMPRVGFGGGRLNQRQQAEPAPVEMDDDPAVYTVMPPPNESRIQSKIGWCEVKTFGHTFPSMHLTDRLRQLSRQLDFETNKTDLELMDDIGSFIKVVQRRQPNNPQPIGTAPKASTQ